MMLIRLQCVIRIGCYTFVSLFCCGMGEGPSMESHFCTSLSHAWNLIQSGLPCMTSMPEIGNWNTNYYTPLAHFHANIDSQCTGECKNETHKHTINIYKFTICTEAPFPVFITRDFIACLNVAHLWKPILSPMLQMFCRAPLVRALPHKHLL